MEFYWPGTSHDSALYRVDVTCGTERMTRISSEPSFGVSGIQEGERLEIRVWAVADGKSLFGKPKEVKSWKCFHAELALPGSSMSEYDIYPIEGFVKIDGMDCRRFHIYEAGDSYSLAGIIFLSGDQQHVYRMDPDDNTIITELK